MWPTLTPGPRRLPRPSGHVPWPLRRVCHADSHSTQCTVCPPLTGLVACCHPCLVLLPRAITGCTARENQGSGRLDFAVQERSGASPAQPTRKEKQYVLFVVDSAMIETSSMNLLSLVLAPTGRTARLRRGRCCSKRPRCATSPAQCCRIPRACTARPNVRAAIHGCRQHTLPAAGNPGFIEALVSCLSPQSKPCSSYPPVGQA